MVYNGIYTIVYYGSYTMVNYSFYHSLPWCTFTTYTMVILVLIHHGINIMINYGFYTMVLTMNFIRQTNSAEQ